MIFLGCEAFVCFYRQIKNNVKEGFFSFRLLSPWDYFKIKEVRSTNLLEYPHSLSYHDKTFMRFPPTT